MIFAVFFFFLFFFYNDKISLINRGHFPPNEVLAWYEMSAADSRIRDGVFIPVRSIDSLQPQSSAFLFKGRPGRRYSVKVDFFRLSVSVLASNGATRHLAFPVLERFRSRSQYNVPPSVSAVSARLYSAAPRCVRNCARRRRWRPTKKKGCVQNTQENRESAAALHASNPKYNNRLLSRKR